VGDSDEDVLRLVVGAGFEVMGIAKVVDRIDEGLVEFVHDLTTDAAGDGLQAEVQEKHGKGLVVAGYPARLEHPRGPASAGDRATIGRDGVGQR
jgi:hypothetical protein